MKMCRVCKQEKLESEFCRHPSTADGFLGICKKCDSERSKLRRLTNPLVQAADRERAKKPETKARRHKVTSMWLKSHPEKRAYYRQLYADKKRAHGIVKRAVRGGRLLRRPCEVCGESVAQAHHDDYSKPLDVRWLCAQHHADIHQRWHRPYIVDVTHKVDRSQFD